jgi:ATP-dependent Clp protease, protease subunit
MKKHNNIGSLLETPRYSECYTNLANERMILLSEDITKDTASSISALLLYYDQENEVDDISIYINTNGGDSGALTNIYDVMQLINAPIKTICVGKAYSAGAFILAAGTKGKRYMSKHASCMIHGMQCNVIGDNLHKSELYVQFLKDNNNAIMQILAKHTGKSLDTIVADCKQDKFMDSLETRAYGIVDHII